MTLHLFSPLVPLIAYIHLHGRILPRRQISTWIHLHCLRNQARPALPSQLQLKGRRLLPSPFLKKSLLRFRHPLLPHQLQTNRHQLCWNVIMIVDRFGNQHLLFFRYPNLSSPGCFPRLLLPLVNRCKRLEANQGLQLRRRLSPARIYPSDMSLRCIVMTLYFYLLDTIDFPRIWCSVSVCLPYYTWLNICSMAIIK